MAALLVDILNVMKVKTSTEACVCNNAAHVCSCVFVWMRICVFSFNLPSRNGPTYIISKGVYEGMRWCVGRGDSISTQYHNKPPTVCRRGVMCCI